MFGDVIMRTYTPEDILKDNELVGIDLQKTDYIVHDHEHKFIEVVFVTNGNGTHSINGTDYDIKRGSLLISNYGSVHRIVPYGDMTHYNIYVRPEFFFNDFCEKSNLIDTVFLTIYENFKINNIDDLSYIEFSGNDFSTIETYIKSMYREYLSKKPGYEKIIESLLYVILTYAMRKMLIITENSPEKTKLSEDILAYIATHYHEKISSKELAERCFYNPSYFSRLFKETTGKSMIEYVQELRIKRACFLLKEAEMSIEAIASEVGYTNPSKFYESFKKLMGMTPLKYRQTFLK